MWESVHGACTGHDKDALSVHDPDKHLAGPAGK